MAVENIILYNRMCKNGSLLRRHGDSKFPFILHGMLFSLFKRSAFCRYDTKRQTKFAADGILIFYFYLSKKIRLDISCESSV